MKKYMTIAALATIAVLLSGCGNLSTTTRVSINPMTHEITWTSHKNICFTNMVFNATSNGIVTFSIGSWYSYTDPAVLNSASAGDVAVMNAAGQLILQAEATGAKGATVATEAPKK
jgi:hypothetical protein